MPKLRPFTLVMLLAAGLFSNVAHGQKVIRVDSSFVMGDPIRVKVPMPGGAIRQFALIRDSLNPYLWYYVLENIQLVEQRVLRPDARGRVADRWPECQLVRFQRENPEKPGAIVEGATLRMTFEHQITDRQILAALKESLVNSLPYLKNTIAGTSTFNDDWDLRRSLSRKAYYGLNYACMADESSPRIEELTTPPASRQNGQILLPNLLLRPLPIRSVKVAISDPLQPASPLPAYAAFPGSWNAGDYKRDYRTIPVTVDLTRDQANLVEGMLRSPITGLAVRFEYRFPVTFKTHRQGARYRFDPGAMLGAYFDDLLDTAEGRHNDRKPPTAHECRFIYLFASEWRAALKAGYRPRNREEAVTWSKLVKFAGSVQPDDGNYRLADAPVDSLLVAAAYALRMRAPNSPSPDLPLELMVGRDLVGTADMDQSNPVNFLSHQAYRSENAEAFSQAQFDAGKYLFAPDFWSQFKWAQGGDLEIVDGWVRPKMKTGDEALFWEVELAYTPDLNETFVTLRDYAPQVVQELIGFRSEGLQPAAVVLPEIEKSAADLGLAEFSISPAVEFHSPSDSWRSSKEDYMKQLNTVIQFESPYHNREDPPVATMIERDGKDYIRLTYPTATWQRGSGWTGTQNVAATGSQGVLSLSLRCLRSLGQQLVRGRQILQAQYVFTQTLKSQFGEFAYETRMQAFEGTKTLPGPGEKFDIVRIDASKMPWHHPDRPGGVHSIRVILQEGGGEIDPASGADLPAGVRRQTFVMKSRAIDREEWDMRSRAYSRQAPAPAGPGALRPGSRLPVPGPRPRRPEGAGGPGTAPGEASAVAADEARDPRLLRMLVPRPVAWVIRRPDADDEHPVRAWMEIRWQPPKQPPVGLTRRRPAPQDPNPDAAAKPAADDDLKVFLWESNNEVLRGEDLNIVLTPQPEWTTP